MLNPTHRAVLQVLFSMASEDRHADVALVADEVGLSCTALSELLEELDGAGLVDATTVRLTMQGLVIAVSSRRAATGKHEARRSRMRPPRRATGRAA